MVLGVLRLGCVDHWKQIAVQGLARFQHAVLEFMERRRHNAGSALKRDIVASPAKSDSAAPQGGGAIARRAVHGATQQPNAFASHS